MIQRPQSDTLRIFFHAQGCDLYHIFLEDVTSQGFNERNIRFSVEAPCQNIFNTPWWKWSSFDSLVRVCTKLCKKLIFIINFSRFMSHVERVTFKSVGIPKKSDHLGNYLFTPKSNSHLLKSFSFHTARTGKTQKQLPSQGIAQHRRKSEPQYRCWRR